MNTEKTPLPINFPLTDNMLGNTNGNKIAFEHTIINPKTAMETDSQSVVDNDKEDSESSDDVSSKSKNEAENLNVSLNESAFPSFSSTFITGEDLIRMHTDTVQKLNYPGMGDQKTNTKYNYSPILLARNAAATAEELILNVTLQGAPIKITPTSVLVVKHFSTKEDYEKSLKSGPVSTVATPNIGKRDSNELMIPKKILDKIEKSYSYDPFTTTLIFEDPLSMAIANEKGYETLVNKEKELKLKRIGNFIHGAKVYQLSDMKPEDRSSYQDAMLEYAKINSKEGELYFGYLSVVPYAEPTKSTVGIVPMFLNIGDVDESTGKTTQLASLELRQYVCDKPYPVPSKKTQVPHFDFRHSFSCFAEGSITVPGKKGVPAKTVKFYVSNPEEIQCMAEYFKQKFPKKEDRPILQEVKINNSETKSLSTFTTKMNDGGFIKELEKKLNAKLADSNATPYNLRVYGEQYMQAIIPAKTPDAPQKTEWKIFTVHFGTDSKKIFADIKIPAGFKKLNKCMSDSTKLVAFVKSSAEINKLMKQYWDLVPGEKLNEQKRDINEKITELIPEADFMYIPVESFLPQSFRSGSKITVKKSNKLNIRFDSSNGKEEKEDISEEDDERAGQTDEETLKSADGNKPSRKQPPPVEENQSDEEYESVAPKKTESKKTSHKKTSKVVEEEPKAKSSKRKVEETEVKSKKASSKKSDFDKETDEDEEKPAKKQQTKQQKKPAETKPSKKTEKVAPKETEEDYNSDEQKKSDKITPKKKFQMPEKNKKTPAKIQFPDRVAPNTAWGVNQDE